MTMSGTTNRVSFAGNGSTTAFSFPHYFQSTADLVVLVKTNTTGAESAKTLTTHYTVSGTSTNGAYDSGGTVTMLSAPATGETLVIYRDPALTQATDFSENGSMPAETVEKTFDKLQMQIQRLDERADRSISLQEGQTAAFDMKLPVGAPTPEALIRVNDAGTGLDYGHTYSEIQDILDQTAADVVAADAAAAAAAASQVASAASASASATSATASAGSATAAAASATAAANTLASALWRGVLRKTFADSPYTVSSSDNGKLIVVDTTGGAVTVNLPAIAGLTLPFTVGVQLDAGTNGITVARGSTDTIDGVTSKSLTVSGSGAQLLADASPAPDEWEVIDFGAQAGNITIDRFNGDGSTVNFTLSVDPGTENNTAVYISGIYQQKDTYSLSSTTLTFSTAPPTGTSNIEVATGTALSLGVPSDGTVTRAKLVTGAIGPVTVVTKTTTYTATTSDDVILCSGSAFTVTLPTAASAAGRELLIKKTDSSLSNIITIDGNGSETIDGALTKKLSTQYESFVIVSDGTNWIVREHSYPKYLGAIALSLNTGWGTIVGTPTYLGWRHGDRLVLQGEFKLGTPATSGSYFTLPAGYTLDTAKVASTSAGWKIGYANRLHAAASGGINADGLYGVYVDSSNSRIYISARAATGTFVATNVDADWLTNDRCTFDATIPMSGWEAD